MHREVRLKKGSRFTKDEMRVIQSEGKILDINTFHVNDVLYEQVVVIVPDKDDVQQS